MNDTAPAPKPAKSAKGAKPAKPDDKAAGKRLKQAEMLLDVSKRMAAIETLDEVLATMVEMTSWELDAERSTLFLNDPTTGELYSRVAQGTFKREIRILNTSGIAGHVFTNGEALIIHDPYNDPRFNRAVDEQTGFVTRNILCVPIRNARGEIIGAAQTLNKKSGRFTKHDLELLEAMTSQATVALQSTMFVERMKRSREKEMEFLDVVADVTSDIDLSSLLRKVMTEATKMLQADRSTLFLNDEKTNQLFSLVGQGLATKEIRFPNHLGIAGAVFVSGKTINIPHAYADLRFNPSFDKQTGFFTRSMLCVPVINKAGKVIGVTQVLNKRGGPFTDEDETRLKAFTAQIAIGLENAKLFSDVQNMKNYTEAMLQSMSNGVVTMDEDGKINTCNAAGLRILKAAAGDIIGKKSADYFTGDNLWVFEKIKRVEENQIAEISMDAEFHSSEEKLSVNLTVLPLKSAEDKKLGTLIMIEDISSEKRVRSTMARYMDPALADQLLGKGEGFLGGQASKATVLFSDIRGFTTLTEELGAQGTVSLLNEYFTIMVDCITRQGGMLDKFIGDAIMAVFGIPMSHEDDEDRAVKATISMISELWAWNAQRADAGKKPVDMGIGLNTDTIVSGNIGSPKRMDYTVIGDGVNLASRLESACKQYSARILISEHTFKALRGIYRAREIDHVVVKGKTEPVAVFEILDYHSDETFPHIMDVLGHFKEGRNRYMAGNWDGAIASFKEALVAHPGDKLSKTYIERCEHLKAEPPANWDGVWVMKSK